VEEAGGRRVALLGLSFKSSTDDLRESPAVALAERLIGKGYSVAIYDPDVHPERLRGANQAFMDEHLPHLAALLCGSLPDALADADTVVIAKRWSELDGLAAQLEERHRIIDLVGLDGLSDLDADRRVGIGW
jgi:GDP-mannose 6-dehydrogenase